MVNRSAFDPNVKGSRPDELGEQGRINARIKTLRRSIDHFTAQLPKLRAAQARAKAAGSFVEHPMNDLTATLRIIEGNKQDLAIQQEALRNVGQQPVRPGDTGRALVPGQQTRTSTEIIPDDVIFQEPDPITPGLTPTAESGPWRLTDNQGNDRGTTSDPDLVGRWRKQGQTATEIGGGGGGDFLERILSGHLASHGKHQS